MKALVLVAKDQPFEIQDVPMPQNTVEERNPDKMGKEGYSIVKIKAAALNHRDVWIYGSVGRSVW